MSDVLEAIFEFQLLRSKEQKLDIVLDEGERKRLMGLSRLLQGQKTDPRRRFARIATSVPVQFTRPGGFESGEVRNVSGGGFVVTTGRPPVPGTRIILRMAHPSEDIEYVFPCRVVWRTERGPGRMGAELDGVPRRCTCATQDTGVWRRSFRFGHVDSEPLVA